MLLRIDDTDESRAMEGAQDAIERDLRWLGLDWDEGPLLQSERRARHLEAAAAAQGAVDRDGARWLEAPGIQSFVIVRADGRPTYRWASAVDDADLGITHVIRGNDHLPNVELQQAAIRSLGAEPPAFLHHALVRGEEGKLSKREGAATIAGLREAGYPPEAVREPAGAGGHLRPRRRAVGEQLVDRFDETRLARGEVTLEQSRLRALSTAHLALLPQDDLVERVAAFAPAGTDRGLIAALAPALRGAHTLAEAAELVACVAAAPEQQHPLPQLAEIRERYPGPAVRAGRAAAGGRAAKRGRSAARGAGGADRARARPGAVGGAGGAAARRGDPEGGMRLRDSLTGEPRELVPGPDGRIGMYVCGPTVYDRIHVGNARPFVVFQWMKRYLEWRGQPVTLVENITDINDKIYTAATARGVPSDRLAAEMAQAYIDDTERLGLGRPDREPLASATMAEIIALVERLIADGHAYEAGGDVYFAVRSFPDYGRLSNQDVDQLKESARAGRAQARPGRLRAVEGDQAGRGHLVGVALGRGPAGLAHRVLGDGRAWLGPEFALHGGGRDLIFPHHENEIAQSAGGRPPVRPGVGAQRHAAAERREDVEVAGQHRPAASTCSTAGAPRRCLVFFAPRPLRRAARLQRRGDATGPGRLRDAAKPAARRQRRGGRATCARRWPRRWTTTSTRRGRWRCCSTRRRRRRAPWRRCWACSAWAASAATRERRRSCWSWPEAATRPAPTATSRRADQLRDQIEAAGWEVRDTAEGTALYRRHGG